MPNLARGLLVAILASALPLGAQEPITPLDSSAGRIMFSVSESFADSTGTTHLVLHVRTERRLHCYKPLRARVSTHGDTITVDRWSTPEGWECISDGDTLPSGNLPLPLEVGRRVLEIVRLGRVDRYRLTVTGDAIQVAPIGTPRVSVLTDDTRLWRFPRNSFALSCDTGDYTAWTCAEVEHLLADERGLVPIEFPARGRNPYATWRGGNGADAVRYFRVADRASYDRLRREIVRLHDAYAGQRVAFNVSILRWTGARWSIDRPNEERRR